MAGFPCQDISISGKKRGIYEGKKSSLWWEVWRITRDLQPRILVLENVANIVQLGGCDVIGSIAEIGYDAEWSIVSARERGSCHLRERWFCVAYPYGESACKRNTPPERLGKKCFSVSRGLQNNESHKRTSYWIEHEAPSAICRVDDGISNRVDRLRALGNAIVPQCSQYVFECIIKSGLL